MKRRILVTGATSGIGLAVAKALVDTETELMLGCRNIVKADRIWDDIRSISAANVTIVELDLSSLESIDKFVLEVEKCITGLDILVNNAGLYMDHAKKTTNGYEMTVGVNYVGSHYLTRKLTPLLLKGNKPQIINICSRAAFFGKAETRKDQFENHSHGFRGYSDSKLMQLMSTLYLADQFAPIGISVNAVHPGGVATGIWRGKTFLMKLMRKSVSRFSRTPDEAAKSILYLIENESMRSFTGCFFENEGDQITIPPKIADIEKCAELVKLTEESIQSKVGPKKHRVFKLGERPDLD